MQATIKDLTDLFSEAKQRSEFEFVLTLINYKGMGTRKLMTNLHEWFEALESYKRMYNEFGAEDKVRIGVLLYSTFFENSDFYNIIGSLCRIKLGYKGSSYLFYKTKKNERLLGIGEKQDFLVELLGDAQKENIIQFFLDNHYKEIRNSFFHSAYSISDSDYILHDSELILGRNYVDIKAFLFPKIENVILFFDTFKKLYLGSFNSYIENKEIEGFFPNPIKVTILGSPEGLFGFRMKNSVSFYGQLHDSGIWYNTEYDMWEGHNIRFDPGDREGIEIDEGLVRYESKPDINHSDMEFDNLVDKILDRNQQAEIARATNLCLKFAGVRENKAKAETNHYKAKAIYGRALVHYRKAVEIGSKHFDVAPINKRIKELEAYLN